MMKTTVSTRQLDKMRDAIIDDGLRALRVTFVGESAPTKLERVLALERQLKRIHGPSVEILECEVCRFLAPEAKEIIACPGCGEFFISEEDLAALEAAKATKH